MGNRRLHGRGIRSDLDPLFGGLDWLGNGGPQGRVIRSDLDPLFGGLDWLGNGGPQGRVIRPVLDPLPEIGRAHVCTQSRTKLVFDLFRK